MQTPDQDFLGVWTFIWLLLKQIWIATLFFTALSTTVTLVNHYYHDILSVESAPITLLGTLVSFMLTVKLKSDEKTWKDGRAEWSAIAANSRQLATLIWHNASVDPKMTGQMEAGGESGPSPQELKNTCMKLLRVFAVATKYGIEGQGAMARVDSEILAIHAALPSEKPPILRSALFGINSTQILDQSPNEIPRDILTTLSACIATLHQTNSLPTSLLPTIETSLQNLQTSLSSLTRTTTTSPPRTSILQTRLSVYAYLFFLPFQLNKSLGWLTIPGEFVVAVVYLGFMAVGVDIGQPFKAGLTKLDVDGLVEDLKRQIDEIAQTEGDRNKLRSLAKSVAATQGNRPSTAPPGENSLIDLEAQPVASTAGPSRSLSG